MAQASTNLHHDITDMQAEALDNARNGASVTNYPAIYQGMMAKGIAEADIKPRENVFTFQAWKALGRSVKKGEHGVRVVTFVPVTDKETGEVIGRREHAATVFHVSQTESTADAEARWARNRAEKGARASNVNRRAADPQGPAWRNGYRPSRPQWRNATDNVTPIRDPGEDTADRWSESHN
jgi:N-terminal domain of anti-restriction factor ArdC